ncbi:bifunctional DNA-formamidopyrimidine glycosylase/DNA-(apurinic or apyrimidinic site) lyase [Inhella gelatinilytica]|uniref:Formamidopyrimidine-DNA glycosylase n=1 Tax=Inhella gelatinilytica TaxID=2795030 RepID=A0A931IWF8_9BURK|nr:bifunctional DNA-formamidopyrimidine glycosylase/DNA-(apurinic or apyrimidinic site) lyase [Inhella gelatinilytica]MBH9551318.1 bifunctional DNA-formamidopyrimidine glycosylase/DNA-(apurinic or apyrimidinic site) lyase [Inhella gelatinilytica]
MPELPEVEITRQGFAQALEGATVQGVRLGKPLRWPLGVQPAAFQGARLGATLRRGKYLWLPLDRPEPRGGVLLHLGMSGSLAFEPAPGKLQPHQHFQLVTDRGTLTLTDPRRFGAVVWSPALDVDPAARLLARLGVEPFDESFTSTQFHAALRGRRQAIKPVLLGGEVIVGAGNIYACEALWQAGIHPEAPSGRLSRVRAERLLTALRSVLRAALEAGGSTLRDFSSSLGAIGRYQTLVAVYGREGQPCPACGQAVRRLVQGQRSTFYCPKCQPR